MEFHEKLQQLRKQKGLTQEDLAAQLYVSRTAISKWESGRGYPNIDSLKQISVYFSVSVDELLSGNQLLTIAQEDGKEKLSRFRDWVFGVTDLCALLLLLFPFFGQKANGEVNAVSLLALEGVTPYMLGLYWAAVVSLSAFGVLTLILQSVGCAGWMRCKRILSLLLSVAGVLLFILSPQPYAAALLFVLLTIKVLLLLYKG